MMKYPYFSKKTKKLIYELFTCDEVFLTIKKIYSQLFFLQLSKDNKKTMLWSFLINHVILYEFPL